MCLKKNLLLSTLFFTVVYIQAGAQKNNAFTISTPESQGVSSTAIINFLEAAAKSKTEFHSFMLLRHGNIVAQGWWNPYSPDLKHTMYSCSKSFTATAIGFAVSENRLTVNDKLISIFPNELPDTISAYLASLTVKDVLTMSDGQEPDPTFAVASTDSNWVKSFLALPIVHQPGSTFLYNSLGTYMLSAIIQKITGQKVIDYLQPRLFEPLGITGADWEMDPKGINTGGWGLRIKTADMAKFGQLFLQKGVWNGKQVLPAAWIEEASTLKIIQHPDYSQAKRDSSDWEQGYCYQMWRCRHNAYRGDGAFGQYIIVMPDEDAVLAITAETPDMQEEINLVWQYLLPGMHNSKLPSNKTSTKVLQQKLATLALPLPAKTSAAIENTLDGKTFRMAPNNRRIEAVSFNFKNNNCTLTLQTDTMTYHIDFGAGSWQAASTTKRGPSLVGGARGSFVGLPPLQIDGAYTWQDDNTLALTLRYIESPHTEKFTCQFTNNTINISIENSFDYGTKKTVVTGTAR